MSASPPPSPPSWLNSLIESAREADGQPPFSDQSLIDLRAGERTLLAISEVAAAIVASTEAELVVAPDARGRGHGSALLATILNSAQPGFLVWAHGDHPAARALAARYGFEPVRRLLQLRAAVSSSTTGASAITEYVPGRDDAAWLALNAKAFAAHAEQGSVSESDLKAMMAEPWFDASTFLLLRDGDALIGYCWLKVEGDIGEIYVIGVDPDRQGEGLGRVLLEAGLARLDELGIRTSSLYVEADNASALKLYESLGYTEYSVDIQYQLVRFTSR